MPTLTDDMRMGYRMDPVRPMTVADLKMLLDKAPAGAHVKLFSDAEGNEIRHLLEVQIGTHSVELVPYD